jgi:serine acetyltransferase
MRSEQLKALKRWVSRMWVFSPERLWLLSIALQARGHWVLSFWVKQLNALAYHNSLAPGATVASDIFLGHNSIGIVVTANCEIGERVKLWQNVTLSAGRPARARSQAAAAPEHDGSENGVAQSAPRPRSRIVVEDGVTIGANSVVIAPRGRTLRIGRGARVGAGTVVTEDVPARATVVGPPSRVIERDAPADKSTAEQRGEP